MSKKPKPRRDFSSSIDVVFSDEDEALKKKRSEKYIKYNEETINSIEKKTNLKFDEVVRYKLSNAIIQYKAGKELIDNRPRKSEQRAALNYICTLSKQLKDALEQIDLDTRLRIIEESDWINIKKTIFDLEIIHQSTQDALDKVPQDKGGRPAQYSLKYFIQELAEIYKDAKGKDPSIAYIDSSEIFYGPFFSFVEAILTEIYEPPFSNSSLGNAIKRALKKLPTPS
jgi:hypothetical protein